MASSAAIVSLTGCLGVFDRPFSKKTEPPASRKEEATVAPAGPASRGTTAPSESITGPDKGSSTDGDQRSSEFNEGTIDGPVDSPLANAHPWIDDPVDGLRLVDVTLATGTDRTWDYLGTMPDELSIAVAGERFTVEGQGHLEWECDTFGLKRVLVDGRVAEVYVEARPNDACRSSENPDGRGPWLTSFTVAGRFNGGRPDAMEVNLEGQYIDGIGPGGAVFERMDLAESIET